MKYQLIVKADTNDADYVTEVSDITLEQLEEIKPVIEAIKNFKPYKAQSTGKYSSEWTHNNNFPIGECYREDLGQLSAEEYYVEKGLVTQEQFDLFY